VSIRVILLASLVLLFTARGLEAQGVLGVPAAGERVRLYLDCNGFYCDSDYYRTELDFVDHVRTRQDADVHLLITAQATGGGGREYTLLFIGQRRFEGMGDTLRHAASQTVTEDERRSGLVSAIKLGLARYAARTAAGRRLTITFVPLPAGAGQVSPLVDPWNFWTFRTNLNGSLDGESRFSSRSVRASVWGSRITGASKVQLWGNGSQTRQRYDVDSTRTIVSQQSDYGTGGLFVRSLSAHWSAGGRVSANASTYYNQDLHLRVAPAIEYSLFPYADATRRQLTVLYTVGANRYDYRETTIFGRDAETLIDHRFMSSLDLKQPWGSLSFGLEGAQILNDPERFSGQASANADVRLIRGLSFNVRGRVSYVKDQIYLSASGATPEEVLLRLQQLETNYRYYGSVGLSYTFGSIYNNVVNPRFGAID
jgi:hypothetical protein